MRKNNITLSFKNIIPFLNNLTAHFTGKEKIITLSLIILMLSFVNIILNNCVSNSSNSVSALSYQTQTGIKFTFNPTINISISSDLAISNLTPGTTSDSNNITVNIATNTSYGYTVSVLANSANLTHSNNTNVFSGIATNANLESLTSDNTWGYSYKNNLASAPTWSNYNGLSTETSKTLFNTDNVANSSIDFKIAAKASNTQPSGAYTNTINFYAVAKPAPQTIDDLTYLQGFASLSPTDLTSVKNSMPINYTYTLKDARDEKEYYIAKLIDNNIWMTQNLDLNIDSTTIYTHHDTDLGYSENNNNATWQPAESTFSLEEKDWRTNYTLPYSRDPGDTYYYTSGSNENDILYNSLSSCINSGHTDCKHYHSGNYYNWPASVASNDASVFSTLNENAPNSICPAGWRLPLNKDINTSANNEFRNLLYLENIAASKNGNGYAINGFIKIRETPSYLVRSGQLITTSLENASVKGQYWTSTVYNNNYAYYLDFSINELKAGNLSYGKYNGISIRCLAR